jgi:hypothetical protein
MIKVGDIWNREDGGNRILVTKIYESMPNNADIIFLDRDMRDCSLFAIIGGTVEYVLSSNRVQPKPKRDVILLKAFDDSIAAWQSRRNGDFSKGIGRRDCALCDLFFDRNCSNCPVSESTGKTHCISSPYEGFSEEYQAMQRIPTLKKFAGEEVSFLVDLKEEYLSRTTE